MKAMVADTMKRIFGERAIGELSRTARLLVVPSTNYHIDILRLGYHGGDGARKVASNIQPAVSLPQTEPVCQTFSATGLIECGNGSVSASWTVPANAVSGVYIAHLVRGDSRTRAEAARSAAGRGARRNGARDLTESSGAQEMRFGCR
jgi:hypothetical protein